MSLSVTPLSDGLLQWIYKLSSVLMCQTEWSTWSLSMLLPIERVDNQIKVLTFFLSSCFLFIFLPVVFARTKRHQQPQQVRSVIKSSEDNITWRHILYSARKHSLFGVISFPSTHILVRFRTLLSFSAFVFLQLNTRKISLMDWNLTVG